MNAARLKAILIVSLLLFSTVVVVTRFDVSTDLGLFLPEPETRFDRLLRHQLDNGASTNIVLLGFQGLERKELAEFSRQFSIKLAESPTFSGVSNSASEMGEEALELLVQYRYRLTKSDLSEKFSEQGFAKALQARLTGLASATGPLEKRFVRIDPTGEVLGLLDDWQGKVSRHKQPNEFDGVWFSEDYSRTIILAEIAGDVTRMENQQRAVQEIRNLFESMREPGLESVMAGPAVFAVESGEDIKSDVAYLTMIAVGLVLLFLIAIYRSLVMVCLVVVPLAAGVLVATSIILLIYGQVHGITLAFGITLAGVAVDYPIHLLTGLRGKDMVDYGRIQSIWRTLRLGVVSTVIAYAAFLVSGFSGLQQLGLFTIVGLVTAALFSRWVMPYLAVRFNYEVSGLGLCHDFLKTLGQGAGRFRLCVVATLVGSVLALTVTDRPILHLNVDSLSPISEQRRAEGKMLRSDVGFWYGGSMMLITGDSQQGVLERSEQLEPYLDSLVKNGTLEGYDMAAHFLPSIRGQAARQAQLADIEQIGQNLGKALAATPFKPAVFDPFLVDLAAQQNLGYLDLEALENTPVGKKLNPLLFNFDDGAAGVVLLHGVSSSDDMTRFAEEHEGLFYMHLKTASTDLVARSVDRVAISMLGCILLIYLTLALGFGNLVRPLRIMIPTFAAAVGAAAILIFSGQSLSIFHLISLLLVVGLGLDYALFFNRLPEHSGEWDTTFKSLWVCGVTTVLVFGILTFSRTPPLQAIGTTVGLGAFMSMVFAAMWSARPSRSRTLKE